MDIEVKCNHCNNFYDVDEVHTGQEIDCPDCGKKFIIQPHQADPTQPAEPSPAAETEAGLLLGLYELKGEVAEGGMGKVFKVHHTGWNVDLAMKQPHAHMFETEAQKQTFSHECEAWINLGLHPHIVSCYYVREIDGVPNIFAEWMEGGDLAHWIDSGKLYEGEEKEVLERILDIAIQFAWGLDYAHENGLIHQDVKPENVMLTPEGDVKIADFGIANAIAGMNVSNTDSTQFGGTMVSKAGAYTPAYCSPEQANGQELTRRTDIWSWAVSVLEMFTEDRLWQSGVVAGTACDEYFESAEIIVPESVKNMFKECFRENEFERPRHFKDIAGKLIEIFQKETGAVYNRIEPKLNASSEPSLLNNRALSMVDLKNEKQAIAFWQQALNSDPNHLESVFNFTLFKLRHNMIDSIEALNISKNIVDNNQNNWYALYLRSLLYCYLNGQSEKTFSLLQKVLEKAPPNEKDKIEGILNKFQESFTPIISFDVNNTLGNSSRFSLDSKNIISIEEGVPKLWDVKTGQCFRTFKDDNVYIRSVQFSPDGKYIISVSDWIMDLWDVSTGQRLRSFKGHTDSVFKDSIKFNPNGKYIISASLDKTVKLWDIETGQCLHTFEGRPGIEPEIFSSDGKYIILIDQENNAIKLWDVETRVCLRVFKGHSDWILSIFFNPDGKSIISVGKDKTVEVWSIETGESLRTVEDNAAGDQTVIISSKGRYIVSKTGWGKVKLWDIQTGQSFNYFDKDGEYVSSVCITPDEKYIILGCEDKTIKLLDINTGQSIRTFIGHTDNVKCISLSPNEKYIASCSSDKTVKLWNMEMGECIHTFEGHIGGIAFVRFSPDGKYISSQGDCFKNDNTIKFWDATRLVSIGIEYELSRIINTKIILDNKSKFNQLLESAQNILEENPVEKIKLLREARLIKGFERNSEILHEWSELYKQGRVKGIKSFWATPLFEEHTDGVRSIRFNPDGKYIASGGEDKTVKLWDPVTGQCIRTLVDDTSTYSVDFSAEGKYIVSGNYNKTVKLWSIETGQCIHTFEGHAAHVNSVNFNPDGQYIASGSGDKTLKLWDMTNRQWIYTYEGHTDEVFSVNFSPDGKYIISASKDKTLKLWNVATRQCLRSFEEHTDEVFSVNFSPDGKYIVSGSDDTTIKLWDIATGQCLHSFEEHTDKVCSVNFSPDGKYIVSGSEDKTIKLWDVTTGQCLSSFEGHTNMVDSVSFSPDGKYIVSGSRDKILVSESGVKTIKLWYLDWDFEIPETADWDNGAEPYLQNFLTLRNYKWDEYDFECLIEDLQKRGYGWLNSEGVRKELISMTRQAALYNQSQFHKLQELLESAQNILGENPVEGIKLLRKAKLIEEYKRDSELLALWSELYKKGNAIGINSFWLLQNLQHTIDLSSVCLSPNGEKIALGSKDNTVKVLNLKTGECLHSFSEHAKNVRAVSFSPDGKYIVSASEDKTVKVWSIETEQCLHTLERHTHIVESVSFSPNGRYIVSAGWDHTVKGWEFSTGKCLCSFEGHTSHVLSVSFSPDGKYIISASKDKTVKLWNVTTWQCLRSFEGHNDLVKSVSFSPDGKYIVSGSYDMTIKLWDTATGQCLLTFQEHTLRVISVNFSPDGRYIISGSEDKTVKVWDVKTGQCICTLEGYFKNVFSVNFSPDGKSIISGSWDNTVKRWYLDWDFEIPERADWDDGAEPYLRNFLTLRNNQWNDDDFELLINDLQNRGYGWLRPEGVRKKLEEMSLNYEKEELDSIVVDSITKPPRNLTDFSLDYGLSNEKQISLNEFKENYKQILDEIIQSQMVFIVTGENNINDFVIGPEAVCGKVLGLGGDPEYGWPKPIELDSIQNHLELIPGTRKHPLILKDGRCIGLSIKLAEYLEIKAQSTGNG